MGDGSCLADWVDCYNVDSIRIGVDALTVSQYSFLCTASRNYQDPSLPVVTAPITVADGAWITADVFVAPGVEVGEGAVALARATVLKDVAPWTVVAGNPARFVRNRRPQTDLQDGHA